MRSLPCYALGLREGSVSATSAGPVAGAYTASGRNTVRAPCASAGIRRVTRLPASMLQCACRLHKILTMEKGAGHGRGLFSAPRAVPPWRSPGRRRASASVFRSSMTQKWGVDLLQESPGLMVKRDFRLGCPARCLDAGLFGGVVSSIRVREVSPLISQTVDSQRNHALPRVKYPDR